MKLNLNSVPSKRVTSPTLSNYVGQIYFTYISPLCRSSSNFTYASPVYPYPVVVYPVVPRLPHDLGVNLAWTYPDPDEMGGGKNLTPNPNPLSLIPSDSQPQILSLILLLSLSHSFSYYTHTIFQKGNVARAKIRY